jgi:hypothetical protein
MLRGRGGGGAAHATGNRQPDTFLSWTGTPVQPVKPDRSAFAAALTITVTNTTVVRREANASRPGYTSRCSLTGRLARGGPFLARTGAAQPSCRAAGSARACRPIPPTGRARVSREGWSIVAAIVAALVLAYPLRASRVPEPRPPQPPLTTSSSSLG